MAAKSAGILMFRHTSGGPEFLLVHPGGPYWARKDEGAWSIPKGEYADGEAPLVAARREFAEETGFTPEGEFMELGTFMQPSGKLVSAWAAEGDFDPTTIESNLFTMEWPPKSGRVQAFAEIDRAAWFDAHTASRKILMGQAPIIAALLERLGQR